MSFFGFSSHHFRLQPIYQDYGFVGHWLQGSGNSDYGNSTIAPWIANANALQMKAVRVDPGLNNDGSFKSSVSTSLLNAMNTNGIVNNMFSVSITQFDVAPAAGGNLYTQSEYTGFYNTAHAKAVGLLANAGPYIKYFEYGSEEENFESNLGLVNTGVTGSNIPDAPTGAGTTASPLRWAQNSNNWKQINYGAHFYAIWGMTDAINSYNAANNTDIQMGFNLSYTHYGLAGRVGLDAINLVGTQLDWCGQDWYNDSEGASPGIAVSGIYNALVATGIYKYMGITETGFYTDKSHSVASTAIAWHQYAHTTYATDTRCKFYFMYEGTNEPVSRTGSEATLGVGDFTTSTLNSNVTTLGAYSRVIVG